MRRMNDEWKNKHKLIALALMILGLALILVNENITDTFWKGVIGNIATALFIAGIFEMLNEYYLKEKLVDLIFQKLKLKETIDKTGIVEVFSDISDIDFRHYIANSKRNIDIYHVYGRSWTNSHLEVLRDRIVRSNCKVRVVLLSPDSSFVQPLAERYEVSNEELMSNIQKMEETWRKLFYEKKGVKKRKTQSNLKLYYSDSFPSYSLYRFDDKVISVQSKPSKGRTTILPTIVLEDTTKANDLFDIYLKEIEEIINQAREMDLNLEQETLVVEEPILN